MTYIILSNDQMVKISPQANRDYVRQVLESDLIGADRLTRSASAQPQQRSLFRQVVRWILGGVDGR